MRTGERDERERDEREKSPWSCSSIDRYPAFTVGSPRLVAVTMVRRGLHAQLLGNKKSV
jgi:hypothetical protein